MSSLGDEPKQNLIPAGDFELQRYAPHHFKATLKGTTKYTTMSGTYDKLQLRVPFTHKLKSLNIRHCDSADALSTNKLIVVLGRAAGTFHPTNMVEDYLNTVQYPILPFFPYIFFKADIIIQFKMPAREESVYDLTLESTINHRIYPVIYISTDMTQETIGPPDICLDGLWNPPRNIKQLPQATTNAYVSLSEFPIYIGNNNKTLIQLYESGGQNVMYKILGSNDGGFTIMSTLATDVDLAANGVAYETLADNWAYLDIQVIDKVGGTHGTVSALVQGGKY